jgi:hypothetical protein
VIVSARLPPAVVDGVDDWAGQNQTTRSEAIRRFVEIGLSKSQTSDRPQVLSPARRSAARAAELAARAIDNISIRRPHQRSVKSESGSWSGGRASLATPARIGPANEDGSDGAEQT